MGPLSVRAALLFWVCGALWALPCLAQTGTPSQTIRFELGVCEAAVDHLELEHQLGIEARALGLVGAGEAPESALTLSLTFLDCDQGATTARLIVKGITPTAETQRDLDLTDTARADRARALGLCAAELLRSLQVVPSEPPAAARAAPAPAEPAAASHLEATTHQASLLDTPMRRRAEAAGLFGIPWFVQGQGATRRLFDASQWLSGAAVGLTVLPLPYLEVGLGLEALTGRNRDFLGRYRTASLLVVSSALFRWRAQRGLHGGAKLMAGEAFARGVGDDARATSAAVRAPTVGVAVIGGGHLQVRKGIELRADLSVGGFPSGLRIEMDGSRVATTRALFVDVSLGARLAL